ncbi:MAG TPA: hypothetical protein VMD09_04080 [Solirubrobacteraceae bacterium]|nr:hypothetical protein [Solirubrobacteraceae bacterium]
MSSLSSALNALAAAAQEEFEDAVASIGEVEHDLLVARRRQRLRFAGGELAAALLPALAPRLVRPEGAADAEICLWEERAVGRPNPVFPWHDDDLPAGRMLRISEPIGMARLTESSQRYALRERGTGIVAVVDRSAHRVLYRVPDAHSLPWWERAAPLRLALHGTLGGDSQALMHAGAVGDARGGLLLVGPSGAGKTTMTLAALQSGMSYVADDYLLLEADRQATAWNLFATAKLDVGHLQRFPVLAEGLASPDGADPEEKVVLDVSRRLPAQLVSSLPLIGVVAPHIEPGESSLRPITRMQGMLAAAPNTVLQMPYDNGAAVGVLSRAMRDLPCFALTVGGDPAELPGVIAEALESAAQWSAV